MFSLLRDEGIEAVLVKGWAVARRYPDRALRPYGDIDLCVAPAQFAKAQRALRCLENIEGHYVDLHTGFGEVGRSNRQGQGTVIPRLHRRTVRKGFAVPVAVSFLEATPHEFAGEASRSLRVDGKAEPYRTVRRQSRGGALQFELATRDWNELFSRSSVVKCGAERVRVLSEEDHLRLLCLHLLRSGARRPTWLCDVALLVESLRGSSPTVREGLAILKSEKSKVESHPHRVAVTDSSRGLRVRRDTPGSDPINVLDPEGVIENSLKSNVQSPTSGLGEQTLDSSFNWDVCLGRNPVHANWVACAILLAHELLGADISHTPFARQVQSPKSNVQSPELPRWLAPAVLKQWGRGRGSSPTVREGLAATLNHPGANRPWRLDFGPWTDLFRRWNNPIRAVAAVGGKFNNWPRLPYRMAESIMRLPELPQHLRLLAKRNLKSRRRSNPQISPITQNGNYESA